MLADTGAAALLAIGAPPPVLADAFAAALFAGAALPSVLADAFAAAVLAEVAPPPVLAILAAPGALSFVRAGQPHCNERRGQKHIKTRNKSESPRPRAVWVDPGRGPGEVSPDPGLTPGQAYEV